MNKYFYNGCIDAIRRNLHGYGDDIPYRTSCQRGFRNRTSSCPIAGSMDVEISGHRRTFLACVLFIRFNQAAFGGIRES